MKKTFVGQMIGDIIPDPSCTDHCLVMVRTPFCSHCHSLTHTLEFCSHCFCTICKKRGHVKKDCPIKCSGCQERGHFRQECLKCPCSHCGGAHPYKKSKESSLPYCPIIRLARDTTPLDRVASVIQEEYQDIDPEAYSIFFQEMFMMFQDLDSVSSVDKSKQHSFLAASIRKFIEKCYKSPEELVQSFSQRIQPLVIVSKCHYIFPQSHKFKSTVPGISEGTYSKGVHYGSIHTIKPKYAYKAQPSKAEALAIAFLGYSFYVDPRLSFGTGVPQGC
jgi:hypothetical protein